jgi:hypothetical protein
MEYILSAGSSPAAASPTPGRVACSDSSDMGFSPPTASGSIDAPVIGLLIGLPVSRAASSTVAADGFGGIGMTIRLLSGAASAVVVIGTAMGFRVTWGSVGVGVIAVSAAKVGLKASVVKEIEATIKECRLAMINDLEQLMRLIDADRRGVASLVAEAM